MTAANDDQFPITVRSLIPSAFLPAVVFEIGNGAVAPILALTALQLGASPATAGFTLSLLGLGQILGDLPAASVANRLGDRRAMMWSALVTIAAELVCFLSRSVVMLDGALLVIGMTTATFYLARQAYMTEVVPVGLRARAMSTMGGSHRLGLFLGPFVGAAFIGLTGLRAAYVVAMVTAAATMVLLALVPDVPGADHPAATGNPVGDVRTVVRDHRRLFLTLGFAVMGVGAVRAARQTVLPLWSEHIGMSAQATSLLFGIASAVDVSLFYPAGRFMDRHGRLAVAVPSMLFLGLTMMVLPLTGNVWWLGVVAVGMSAANGLGAGIIVTLGADVAPTEIRLRFLSIWRVMSDIGGALGPIVVSVMATLFTLAAGIVGVGAIGPLSALGLRAWAPRYSRFATRAMMRKHRAMHST